jgi:ergothioneine biosynthesis protein EgtB
MASHQPEVAPARAHRLRERYADVRAATSGLAAPLSPEDQLVQSMPDASPTKWHLAHTTWFFEAFVLSRFVPGYRVVSEQYAYLFNSYYEAVGPRQPRPRRGAMTRPSLDEVRAYRDAIDERMDAFLDTPPGGGEALDRIDLGLHHEQQHQELILTDLKHLLSRHPLKPPYQKQWPLTPIRGRARTWIPFRGGLHEIGHASPGFAFDNESPRHRVWAEDFEMASHPVTHGDFLDFIDDGGYRRPELWLSAGWDLVRSRGWHAPEYWQQRDGCWHTFTLHGEVPVDRNTPICHVSFYEAEAFARWANARLPTEAEWEVAAASAPRDGNFVESGALHPLALREDPAPGTLAQAFGDVWEWTRSDYAPYPGFQPQSGAIGEYNGKFMVGQMVLRGGSLATPPGHARRSYRNFFPPAARWQFSGLRLAKDGAC